ncbi:MAG: hypothetical protein HY235_12645 [Acidobacteria bacterium]|nr:hypothetical protein [Acidobacteriota bacterium]
MLIEAFKAVFGILLLMALWFAVQALIRKRMAAGPHVDVLEDMTRGCGSCSHDTCGDQTCAGEKRS